MVSIPVLCIFMCFHVSNYHPFISVSSTPFSISFKAVLVVVSSIIFLFLGGKSSFCLPFWRQLCQVKYSWLAVSFSQDFENIILFFPGLQGPCSEICCSLMELTLYERVFFSCCFWNSFFVFDLVSYITIHLLEDHLGLKFCGDLLPSLT